MTDLFVQQGNETASKKATPLCWICALNKANSGEHKTKRSDLAAVLGEPTQHQPFYFHNLERHNKPVGSLNAKILKAPIRICFEWQHHPYATA